MKELPYRTPLARTQVGLTNYFFYPFPLCFLELPIILLYYSATFSKFPGKSEKNIHQCVCELQTAEFCVNFTLHFARVSWQAVEDAEHIQESHGHISRKDHAKVIFTLLPY